MSRVFIIHGWGGNPKKEWFPWAKKEISNLGFEVVVPEMPDTNYPKIGLWVNKLHEVVGEIKDDDIFIGHSIGCQTILRFLNTVSTDQKADRLILVAPWWYLNLSTNEEKILAEPWLKFDVNMKNIKEKVEKVICIFSKDDPVVPFKINKKLFKDNFNAEIIVEDKKGHFSAEDGVFEIPVLLKLLMQ